ncbi:MAG: hypothetical protein IT377_34350 [Polyangiaceae bacterium]|nr:hypothetical protein [Polyangiaceae bacterium]
MTTPKNPKRPIARRPPIIADRVRRIGEGGFAFLPNRFLRDGFFASLAPDELRLYVLLVLAGDRDGISFYHYDRLCSLLEVPLERYLELRNALIERDLVAFDGTRFQVLSLPTAPRFAVRPALRSPHDLERGDPATIRSLILGALDRHDPET